MEQTQEHNGPDPNRAHNDAFHPARRVRPCISLLNLDACATWEDRVAVLQKGKEAVTSEIQTLEQGQYARSQMTKDVQSGL